MRGIRNAKAPYRVTAFGTKTVADQEPGKGDYCHMLVEVVKFFQTGIAPVPLDETLEIMTFMEAADESKRQGGCPVRLTDVLKKNGG